MGRYSDLLLSSDDDVIDTSTRYADLLSSDVPQETVEAQGQTQPTQNVSDLPLNKERKSMMDIVSSNMPSTARDFIGERPIPENMRVRRESDRGASMGDLAVSSFADDPAKRIAYLAGQRFPDIPLNSAMQRYGYFDGEIVYRGDDGNIYSESPGLLDKAASEVSKVLPIGASIGTGIATAPMWLAGPAGMATSAGATAAAGAGGEAVRQFVGKQVMDDPFSGTDVAMEGAYGLACEAVGGVATKFMGRKVAKDIAKINTEDLATLQRLSDKYGISLTPAELTNLPSLKAQQKALGNITESADQMDDFYKMRGGQIDDAVERQLGAVSSIDSQEIAGELTRSAARNTMKDVAEHRAKQASPLYKKAFAESKGEDKDGS